MGRNGRQLRIEPCSFIRVGFSYLFFFVGCCGNEKRCIFVGSNKHTHTMTTEVKPYKVIEIVKFGMLFGYAVRECGTGRNLYEYSEDEKHLADTKCSLKNALKGF